MIQDGKKELKDNGFKNDPFAKEFGITVADHFKEVQGRVLQPPQLSYQGGSVPVHLGKWEMKTDKK